jgi:hypothetical protein
VIARPGRREILEIQRCPDHLVHGLEVTQEDAAPERRVQDRGDGHLGDDLAVLLHAHRDAIGDERSQLPGPGDPARGPVIQDLDQTKAAAPVAEQVAGERQSMA